MVRLNMTLKDQLQNTIKEIRVTNLKNLTIVVNDLKADHKRFRYGGKYWYHYSYKSGNIKS